MNTKGYLKKIVTAGVLKSYNKMSLFLFSKLVSIGVLCDVWLCACAELYNTFYECLKYRASGASEGKKMKCYINCQIDLH